jgi:hypothetical protein
MKYTQLLIILLSIINFNSCNIQTFPMMIDIKEGDKIIFALTFYDNCLIITKGNPKYEDKKIVGHEDVNSIILLYGNEGSTPSNDITHKDPTPNNISLEGSQHSNNNLDGPHSNHNLDGSTIPTDIIITEDPTYILKSLNIPTFTLNNLTLSNIENKNIVLTCNYKAPEGFEKFFSVSVETIEFFKFGLLALEFANYHVEGLFNVKNFYIYGMKNYNDDRLTPKSIKILGQGLKFYPHGVEYKGVKKDYTAFKTFSVKQNFIMKNSNFRADAYINGTIVKVNCDLSLDLEDKIKLKPSP